MAVDTFTRFALRLNVGLGETHVMIRFAGHGVDVARGFFLRDGNCISGSSSCVHFTIHGVDRYKHLGTITTITLALGFDISSRNCGMRNVLRPIVSRFLRARRIDIAIKVSTTRWM